jgi:hypothetical protein
MIGFQKFSLIDDVNYSINNMQNEVSNYTHLDTHLDSNIILQQRIVFNKKKYVIKGKRKIKTQLDKKI